MIGGNESVPLFVGRQPDFVGLDQINSAELPRSLTGRGRVSFAVTANGFSSSNLAEVEIAAPVGTTPPQVSSFNPTTATAGQQVTIIGAGFSVTPNENVVRIGGIEASVDSATPTQLLVTVPFGAESGKVSVRTPQGEGTSASTLTINTSISGFVETTSRQPLSGATVKLVGTQTVTTTDAEGAFILPKVSAGQAFVELDASAVQTMAQYPKVVLRTNAAAGRDNQFPQPVALQPISNAGITVGAAGLGRSESASIPASTEEGRGANAAGVQTGNVTFELPVGARASFPDGSSSGTLSLTVVSNARTAARLPVGYFSSTIVQITPFGATLDLGGKLTFPNTDGLPVGTQAKLYRFDQRQDSPNRGSFIEAGFATVSADGQRIETLDGVITETGYYFVSVARATTTVIGSVLESGSNVPVRRVLVRSRGQEGFTDGSGGFILRNVPVRSGEQITVEASYRRPKGRVDRVQRDNIPVTVGGVTLITPELVLPGETAHRPPILLPPTSFRAIAGQTTDVNFIALAQDNAQIAQIGVSGAAFASVINHGNGAYTLHLTPGLNNIGDYVLVLTATDNQNASTIERIALSVLALPPNITDINPKSACVGAVIILTGVSLKAGNSNPAIGFIGTGGRRIPAMVSSASATEVRVTVPNGATTGSVELTNDLGRAVSGALTVLPSQDFQLVVSPSSATVIQGATATYIVSITNGNQTCSQLPLTQLVSLSVTGLPGGVNASFKPEQITAGASTTLSLVLPGNTSPSSYPLTISGKTKVDGNDLERTASASLTVQVTGQTTLAGRVLSMKNEPIIGATVSLDGKSASTDASGAFLLVGITAGVDRPVMVNGRTANAPNRTYPLINEPVTVIAGQANIVPYTFFLPEIDTVHEMTVVSTQNTVVTTPMAPGLSLTIPAGANLTNRDGSPVTRVSLTSVEIDRTPAPLPPGVGTTMVFTAQPGGARPAMRPNGTRPAMPVTYPNLAGANPGTRVELWNFNHDQVKWYVYGYGRVSTDGRTIEPEIDPTTGKPYGLPDFSWHLARVTPKDPPRPCPAGTCCLDNGGSSDGYPGGVGGGSGLAGSGTPGGGYIGASSSSVSGGSSFGTAGGVGIGGSGSGGFIGAGTSGGGNSFGIGAGIGTGVRVQAPLIATGPTPLIPGHSTRSVHRTP